MEYKIKEEVANSILNYLASKPYSEVAKLITELQKIEPIEEPKEVKEEVTKK